MSKNESHFDVASVAIEKLFYIFHFISSSLRYHLLKIAYAGLKLEAAFHFDVASVAIENCSTCFILFQAHYDSMF